MHVPWPYERCVLCLDPFEPPPSVKRQSRAHVVPKSIGGGLTVDALCSACNERMSRSWERHLPLDPTIRMAIENLAPTVPKLDEMRTRAQRAYIGKTDDVDGVLNFRALGGDSYEILPTTLPDSRVVGNDTAEEQIVNTLRRQGAGDEAIDEQLAAFRSGSEVTLGDQTLVPRSSEIEVGLPLDEQQAAPQVFLGMAFLYLAIDLKDEIYPASRDDDPYAELRADLLAEPPSDPATSWPSRAETWSVTPSIVRVPEEPMHGIAIVSSRPPTVRIYLFRSNVWDVELPIGARDPSDASVKLPIV